MILGKAFYVPVEEKMYARIPEILKDEFGLVDPDFDLLPPDPNKSKVLVWEDETGIGRYRVHCYAQQMGEDGNIYDHFSFHYWTNQKLARQILERDPMKPALERVLSEVKNRIDIPNGCID